MCVIDAGVASGSSLQERVDACVDALNAFVRPGADLSAAAELMLAARFDAVLHESIVGGARERVVARCSTVHTDAISATKASFLVVAALGYLLTHRRPDAANVDIREDVFDLLTAFDNVVPATPLPKVDAPQWERHSIEEPDLGLRSLLEATLDEVAERGYGDATFLRICARSGVSQGFLYSHFATKVELFIEATRRNQLAGFEENRVFAENLSKQMGEPLTEAIMMREYCNARHARGFSLVLEQLRLAWFNERMREVHQKAQAEFVESVATLLPGRHKARYKDHMHWNLSLGFGSHLISDLLPQMHELPLDVVMVPLVESQNR